MSEAAYVLDANVFIEAARRYYAFDLAPRFWDSLIEQATNGYVLSIDRVQDELLRGKDELAEWAKQRFGNEFESTAEADVMARYRELMEWVQAQEQFSDAARSGFASGADGWLVAYAQVHGCVVVTHEVLSPEARRKVPIPNLCDAFDVQWVDTFTMLRELGVRFT